MVMFIQIVAINVPIQFKTSLYTYCDPDRHGLIKTLEYLITLLTVTVSYYPVIDKCSLCNTGLTKTQSDDLMLNGTDIRFSRRRSYAEVKSVSGFSF